MAELVLSMILRADAAQARAELATVPVPLAAIQAALQQVVAAAPNAGRAVAQAGQSAQAGMAAAQGASVGLASANQSAAMSFEQLRASVDPAYAASERYRQVQVALAAMVESGEASQRAANIVLEQAASRYMGVATAAERKAQAERDAAMATALATHGYQALRMALDPVYAASQRYEVAVQTLDAAQAAGVISDQERLRTLKLLDAQMIDTAGTAAREAAANRQHAQSYETIRASVDQVYAVSRRYEAAVEALTAAQAAGVISDQERLRTLALLEAQMIQTGAAGRSVGDVANATNLGYQANDIMMMAAMGQSPMALTLQQGPQVIQILNQMRASGQAIGPAILGSITSLINPMSLLTLGVIAGGAALAQWAMGAMGAGEEAISAEDAIRDLSASIDDFQSWMELAVTPVDVLAEKFGRTAERARELAAGMVELKKLQLAGELDVATRTAGETLQPFMTEMQEILSYADPNVRQSMATRSMLPQWGLDLDQADEIRMLLFDLQEASGWEAQATAAQALADRLTDIRDQSGQLPTIFRDAAAALSQAAFEALEFGAAIDPETEAAQRRAEMLAHLGRQRLGEVDDERGSQRGIQAEVYAYRATQAEAEAERLVQLEDIRNRNIFERQRLLDDERGSQAAIRAEVVAIRDLQAEDTALAQDRVAGLNAETRLQTLIAQFGADSVQVEEARAAAARDAFVAWTDGLAITADLRDELTAAYDAQVAQVGAVNAWAGALAGVRGQLEGILGVLAALGGGLMDRVSMGTQMAVLEAGGTAADARLAAERQREDAALAGQQMQLRAQYGNLLGGIMGSALQVEADGRRAMQDDLAAMIAVAPTDATGGGGGGGGGGGAAAERDAVDDLIASLRDEIAIARELDPVQQELLRHREVLAEATAGERAEVEALIRQRDAEAEAHERLQEQMAETRDLGADLVRTLVDGFRDGASGAEILASMLDKIADKLLDMASDGLTDALFGTGEAGGGTGLLGDLFGGLFGGFGLGGGGAVSSARPHALGAVYDRPLYFAMGGGLGVMAEAGAEAIMPLTHAHGGGVGALIGGRETTLPLARLASGKLGVDLGAASPFAMGGAFGDIAAAQAPASWRQALSGSAAASADPDSAGKIDINVSIDLRGAEGDQRATIAKAVREAVAEGLRQYDRALPSRVRSITADPRVR